jgi:hypothetical protein
VAEAKQQRSFSALLAFAGLVLLGLCVVTALRRQDVLAGGLAVLGLGAMVLAALTPRLTGPVEMGLTGFKMELVKLSEVGRLAGYSEEDILAAIEDKLGRASEKPEPPLLADKDFRPYPPSGSTAFPPARGPYRSAGEELDEPSTGATWGDVDEDIDLGNLTDPAVSARFHRLLAETFLREARNSGRPEDFQHGIESLRAALAKTSRDAPMYPEAAQRLAEALNSRYHLTGAATDLDEIVDFLDQIENARRRRES